MEELITAKEAFEETNKKVPSYEALIMVASQEIRKSIELGRYWASFGYTETESYARSNFSYEMKKLGYKINFEGDREDPKRFTIYILWGKDVVNKEKTVSELIEEVKINYLAK